MTRGKGFLGLVIIFGWATYPLCEGKAQFPASPFSAIEAYGDSLTSGLLSATDVTRPPALAGISHIMSEFAMYFLTQDKRHLAKHHRPELAWPALIAQGLLAKGLAALANHAVSGACLSQLIEQVQRQPLTEQPTAAFFFIGHNDFCSSLGSPHDYSQHFQAELLRALTVWDERHDQSVAYLMPLGDMYRVFVTLKGYTWYEGAQARYSCEDSWEKFFPYCSTHSRKFKSGSLENFLNPRRQAANQAIERVAKQLSATSRKNQYVYLTDLFERPFLPHYFAIDCYHLSAHGQAMVAEQVLLAITR